MILSLLILVSNFSLAQAPPMRPVLWDHPNRAPFDGSMREAARMLVHDGFPGGIVAQQMFALSAGQCRSYTIREGDHYQAMLFRGGLLHNVVAEPDLWPDSIPRRAWDCAAADARYEYHLIVPDICHNYSEMVWPRQLPAGAEEIPPTGLYPGPGALGFAGFPEEIGGNIESAEFPGLGALASGLGVGTGGNAFPGQQSVNSLVLFQGNQSSKQTETSLSREVVQIAINRVGPTITTITTENSRSGNRSGNGGAGAGSHGAGAVPEPASATIFLTGLAIWTWFRRAKSPPRPDASTGREGNKT